MVDDARNEKRSQLISELQMITGVVSDDISYLYYCLIKDGIHFKMVDEVKSMTFNSNIAVQDVNDWFANL